MSDSVTDNICNVWICLPKSCVSCWLH